MGNSLVASVRRACHAMPMCRAGGRAQPTICVRRAIGLRASRKRVRALHNISAHKSCRVADSVRSFLSHHRDFAFEQRLASHITDQGCLSCTGKPQTIYQCKSTVPRASTAAMAAALGVLYARSILTSRRRCAHARNTMLLTTRAAGHPAHDPTQA